jgi:intein/homing endonuclease
MRLTIGNAAIKKIQNAVVALFARAKARLLGYKPPKEIRIAVISSSGSPGRPLGVREDLSLPSIFDSSARAEGFSPSPEVREALNRVASGYLDAHSELAKVRVVNAVQNWLSQAESSGTKTDIDTVLGGELAELMGKVTTGVKAIVETESTRARNAGTLDAVTKIAAIRGVDDPNVFFVIVRDEHVCSECLRLHQLDGTIASKPKVYKLSEVGHGYHKKGQDSPKVSGLHPHCFTGGVRLHTDRGLLTVKELYDQQGAVKVVVDARVKNRRVHNNQFGDEIPGETWLDRHASGVVVRPATVVYDTGVQECLRISLSNGSTIDVSEGHEFWIDDDGVGQKQKASELVLGQKIPLLSGEGLWGEDSFPELAELMGNLIGDGYIDDVCAQWHFFGNDIPYGKKLVELARPYCTGNLSKTMTVHPPDEKYSVDRASFNSNSICRIFKKEFGLSKKPRRIPKRIWGANKETCAGFLRGLYAADGHSEVTPSVVVAQNDREFLLEIQQLLSNFGIVSRLFTHGEETTKKITYSDGRMFDCERKPCWRLHIGGFDQVSLFSRSIGMGVPEKQRILEERLQKKVNDARHGSWRTARIVGIEKIGSHQTYCLTEPMSNTVTANGMVVGQCRCSMCYLAKGFGFDGAGKVTYIGPNHDEYLSQQD